MMTSQAGLSRNVRLFGLDEIDSIISYIEHNIDIKRNKNMNRYLCTWIVSLTICKYIPLPILCDHNMYSSRSSLVTR